MTASAASIGATGTGIAVDSGPLSLPFAPALLVAADALVDSSTQPDPRYTPRLDDVPLVEDRVVTATGSYSATDTQSNSAGWLMQLVAFSVY